MFPSY